MERMEARMKFTNKHTGETLSGRQGFCGACHSNFTSQTAFESHRSGPYAARVCLDPTDAGLVPKDTPTALIWGLPTDGKEWWSNEKG